MTPADEGSRLEIRPVSVGDEALVRRADALFDHPFQAEAVAAYLRNPANYLLLALVDGEPAGFARGQELQRLDTARPMLFLYEVGVGEAYRGRGIGTALVMALARMGEARGCCEMFVLTDQSNEPAMRMYAAAGGRRSEERDIEMFEWSWPAPEEG